MYYSMPVKGKTVHAGECMFDLMQLFDKLDACTLIVK